MSNCPALLNPMSALARFSPYYTHWHVCFTTGSLASVLIRQPTRLIPRTYWAAQFRCRLPSSCQTTLLEYDVSS